MKLIPSVWTDLYPELSLEEAVLAFEQGLFCATELSVVHLKHLMERGAPETVGRQLRGFLDDRGFAIPQAHLSFKRTLLTPEGVEGNKRELDLFLALGVQNAVVHFNGGEKLPPQERVARRMESLQALLAHVRGTPLCLCIENLSSVPETQTTQKLLSLIEAAGGENLGICLDTGHLHLTNGKGDTDQSLYDFIVTAGKHLRALHITNNNGTADDHLMPYCSRFGIQWEPVMRGLRDADYEGLFNLEVLADSYGPLPLRHAKLKFMRQMLGIMCADEFLS